MATAAFTSVEIRTLAMGKNSARAACVGFSADGQASAGQT